MNENFDELYDGYHRDFLKGGKVKLDFSIQRWSVSFSLYRYVKKEDPHYVNDFSADVFLHLSAGYGQLSNSLSRGIFFYFDVLRFGVGELHQFRGFSIPIESKEGVLSRYWKKSKKNYSRHEVLNWRKSE